MNWMDLISSVLGLTCVFLAGRNSKYNFWVGYIYAAALFVLFWQNRLFASLALQPISLGITILGHYRWTHPKENERSSDGASLMVSKLSIKGRVISVAVVTVMALAWGLLLSRLFPQDPQPFLDSCVTALILLAQYLSAQKKWDCWIVWLLVNVTQLILHISVGNIFMPIVSALYLVNGIASLVNWGKIYRDQRRED